MDPCSFFRIRVGNLSLKVPSPTPPNSESDLFYCKIKLPNFPLQTTSLPVFTPESPTTSSSACFTLTKSELDRILLSNKNNNKALSLTIQIYRRSPNHGCGLVSGSPKLVGRVRLVLDLGLTAAAGLLHNGWVPIPNSKTPTELHVSLKLEHDPRYLFEFESESECSPQVFQRQGSLKQPVFSCKFALRTTQQQLQQLQGKGIRERKGWTLTIHDLSGSPVAAASMVTPFVASPGSDRVSRSNPGAWLILRPADSTWNPWGRLEAWCEGSSIAYRFDILSAAGGITLSNGSLSGGNFDIDIAGPICNSPVSTPSSSFDLNSWSGSECGSGGWCWGPQWMYRGFVMSSTSVGGQLQVQVGAQHVTCAEDAAVFVALAAAADLSVDACLPFSKKLRKELRHPTGDLVL